MLVCVRTKNIIFSKLHGHYVANFVSSLTWTIKKAGLKPAFLKNRMT